MANTIVSTLLYCWCCEAVDMFSRLPFTKCTSVPKKWVESGCLLCSDLNQKIFLYHNRTAGLCLIRNTSIWCWQRIVHAIHFSETKGIYFALTILAGNKDYIFQFESRFCIWLVVFEIVIIQHHCGR